MRGDDGSAVYRLQTFETLPSPPGFPECAMTRLDGACDIRNVMMANIEQHDLITGCEPALQFVRLDPCRLFCAEPAKQPGQQCDHSKHSEAKQSIPQGPSVTRRGRTGCIAKPRIGNSASVGDPGLADGPILHQAGVAQWAA